MTFNARTMAMASAAGLVIALAAAFVLNQPHHPQSPAFAPAANPFAKAIYATGVIESAQASGENINIDPEVSGPVVNRFVQEGDRVRQGQPLFRIDDSVQRATAQQTRYQAAAALALLQELKAEPRRETLQVAMAQVDQAQASFVTLERQAEKLRTSYGLDPRSVSRTSLDSAEDSAEAARAALSVARRQLELTKAGAWSYDIANQDRQYQALSHAADSAQALLDKYVVKAPQDGVVLAFNASTGGFVAPTGVYETYTQSYVPVVVMGGTQRALQVRVYVDEILLHRLNPGHALKAEMIVRGSDAHVPLRFVRVQPYVTPKIELSDERQERVDLRVLPVIFQFDNDPKLKLYPGQLVDVYVNEQ
jgi:HlyD family secretion protein